MLNRISGIVIHISIQNLLRKERVNDIARSGMTLLCPVWALNSAHVR